MGKLKIVINDNKVLELMLQKIYDETEFLENQVQNEINKITNSTNLVDEIIDSKSKYAKAINDLLVTKSKAIATKLDIGKLMTEIIKFNGDVNKAINDNASNAAMDLDKLQDMIKKQMDSNNQNDSQTYLINK